MTAKPGESERMEWLKQLAVGEAWRGMGYTSHGILYGDKGLVAKIQVPEGVKITSFEMARDIVLACNSHTALLAACKSVESYLQGIKSGQTFEESDIVGILQSAISKAAEEVKA